MQVTAKQLKQAARSLALDVQAGYGCDPADLAVHPPDSKGGWRYEFVGIDDMGNPHTYCSGSLRDGDVTLRALHLAAFAQ